MDWQKVSFNAVLCILPLSPPPSLFCPYIYFMVDSYLRFFVICRESLFQLVLGVGGTFWFLLVLCISVSFVWLVYWFSVKKWKSMRMQSWDWSEELKESDVVDTFTLSFKQGLRLNFVLLHLHVLFSQFSVVSVNYMQFCKHQ